ncbi:MAG: CoA-binding protein [Bacillota bacterium]
MDFKKVKQIAVVGITDDPEKPSYKVARYLQENGFRIIPVNPKLSTVLGENCYPDVLAIPGDLPVDVVDIFRRADAVLPIVEEALRRPEVSVIWMQEGVVNEAAATAARAANREVVMDKCIKKEHEAFKDR